MRRSPGAAPVVTWSSARTSSRCCCSPRDEGGGRSPIAKLRDELSPFSWSLVTRRPRTGLAGPSSCCSGSAGAGATEGGARRGARGLPRGGGQGDLRLRPVIMGVGRVVRGERFELGGYEIPPGAGDQPVDRDDPPSRGSLPRRAACVSPRAFPWPRCARHLHLAALRRRHASLPGRELRHVRDAGRYPPGVERTRLATVGGNPEKGVRRGITFVPAGGVRVRLAASPVAAATAIDAQALALSP